MDNQNDTNKDDFSKGQNMTDLSHKGQFRFVNMDSFVSFIEKKTEQVATALYLVSDSIEERDPIRHRIKEKALEIITIGKNLPLLSAVEKHFEFHALGISVNEIVALLRIASTIGEISSNNENILVGECKKITDGIEVILSEEATTGYQNPSFGEKAVASFKLEDFLEKQSSQEGQTRPTLNEKNDAAQSTQKDTERVSDTEATKNDINAKKQKDNDNRPTDIAIHHIRRQSIIKILNQKGKASLSDIKAVIPDVSEKTIQRELMSLIEEGVVLKEGDKRWARYALAQK